MIQQTEPTIGEKEQKAVAEYLESGGWLTEFNKTKELENRIAAFLGVQHCILVPSGTTALTLASMVLKPKYRNKVIVPDMTMIATANAVYQASYDVEFCDIKNESLCLDWFNINKLSARQSDEIAGIVYVDFNGRASDYAERITGSLLKMHAKRLGLDIKTVHLAHLGILDAFPFRRIRSLLLDKVAF